MGCFFKELKTISIHTFFFVLSIVLLVIFGSGCSKKQDPIKIGLATTLTGKASTWGFSSRNAISMAVEEINASGGINGRMVELIVKNDKADPKVSLQVDRELIDEGVVAILGHYLSSPSIEVIPLMNEKKVLMLSTGTSSAAVTGLDDQFIRLLVPLDKKAPYLASVAKDKLSVNKMTVVYDLSNPKYTKLLHQHFVAAFKKIDGKISKTITFDARETISIPSIAREIMATDSQGVYIIADAINTALICQHLRKNGSKIKVIASGWAFPDPNFIKTGGQSVEGVVAVNEFNKEAGTKAFLKFKTEYERRFDSDISLAGQISYEAAQILFSALSKTQEPYKIKETILGQGVFKVLGNEITIDKFGDPIRPMYVLVIKNQKIKTLSKINPVKP